MHRIRDELEDLSFEVLNIDARSLIQKRLDEIKTDKKDIFETLSNEIDNLLKQTTSNLKSLEEKNSFSIWRKVQKREFH